MIEPDELWRSDAWITLTKKREYQVIKRLMVSVIRESKNVKDIYHPANYIYTHYYKEGMLVARWPQEILAQLLGTTRRRINHRIQKLNRMKVLTKIRVKNRKNTICYYQLGTWKKVKDKNGKNKIEETWFLYEHFMELAKQEKEQRQLARDEKSLIKLIADGIELYGSEEHESVIEFKKRLDEVRQKKVSNVPAVRTWDD